MSKPDERVDPNSDDAWKAYITQMLDAGFMYATINGHDGSMWACSLNFTIGAEECSKLANVMANDDIGSLATGGFTVAGQNYTMTRGECQEDEGLPSFVQGRCKEAEKTSQGVVVFRTNQAVLAGVHDPAYSNGASFGKVNTDLGRIADYMWETGY